MTAFEFCLREGGRRVSGGRGEEVLKGQREGKGREEKKKKKTSVEILRRAKKRDMVSPPPRASTPLSLRFFAGGHIKHFVPVPSMDLGTSPRTLGRSCGGRIRRKKGQRRFAANDELAPSQKNSKALSFAAPSSACVCRLRASSEGQRAHNKRRGGKNGERETRVGILPLSAPKSKGK